MEQNGWKRDVKRLVLVVAASCVMAMNIKSFVRAGGLFPGGFTGLTLLIQQAADKFFHFSVPYSAVNLLLNLAPIMISFRFIGKKFTLYSCVAIVLTSILTDILPGYPITSDILLICVFGGLINGFAVSLCLFAGATSGGTDFIAIFFSERKGKETWNYILAGNVLMLAAAGFLFSWEQALYSIIFQFASTQILNGLYSRYQKLTLLIITERLSGFTNRSKRSLITMPRCFRGWAAMRARRGSCCTAWFPGRKSGELSLKYGRLILRRLSMW